MRGGEEVAREGTFERTGQPLRLELASTEMVGEDLALILTSEQGKPLSEALGEVDILTPVVNYMDDKAGSAWAGPSPAWPVSTPTTPASTRRRSASGCATTASRAGWRWLRR